MARRSCRRRAATARAGRDRAPVSRQLGGEVGAWPDRGAAEGQRGDAEAFGAGRQCTQRSQESVDERLDGYSCFSHFSSRSPVRSALSADVLKRRHKESAPPARARCRHTRWSDTARTSSRTLATLRKLSGDVGVSARPSARRPAPARRACATGVCARDRRAGARTRREEHSRRQGGVRTMSR